MYWSRSGVRTAVFLPSTAPGLTLVFFCFSKTANMFSILANNHAPHTNTTSIPALFCRMWGGGLVQPCKVTKAAAAACHRGQVPWAALGPPTLGSLSTEWGVETSVYWGPVPGFLSSWRKVSPCLMESCTPQRRLTNVL